MNNKVILIVDDEPHNIDVLFDDLTQAGFKILVAENGETALKRISHINPDIILLDVKMPGIDGFETCSRLKAQEKIKDVPIIFMTAVADTAEKLKGFELGAIDYILKPFQATEVVARVEKHLMISQLQKRLEAQNTQLQQEIIKREQIEKSLRESEMKNSLLLQHSPDLIMNVERDGRITYINHSIAFISETVIDKKFIAFLPSEYHEQYSQALHKVFEEKQADSFEYKNSDDQYFFARVVPIEWDNEIVSAMVISTNITERRKNAELEQAVRLKDEFLANMSHELRTPLSAVLMMSEILMENAYGKLNEKQLKTVEHIDTSARHLLSLINDILDLSKITAGQLELQLGPVNVTAVCNASLVFIKEIAAKKKIKVLFVADNNIDTLVLDERRFKQILVNLLNNAIKFTPEGGRVILEVEGEKCRNLVHFNILDTGIGIPENQIERLFQPFVQIDGSLSRSHEGTGLGLSLVHKLTEMHGGNVNVKSTVCKGSQFIVSIPWLIGETPVLAPPIEEKTPLIPIEIPILLVEDQKISIFAIQSCLVNYGYHVTIAHNGKEALEKIKENKPALILMDIQMPVMDGFEAIRQIRADKNISDIPIIALTALAMSGDRERCLNAGANEYLSKPVNINKLVSVLNEQLQN